VIEALHEKLAIPETCHLGKRVFKKLFYEHAQLGVTDRKAFADDVDTVVWQYTVKPSTVAIQHYGDAERDYSEIAWLQVEMNTKRRAGRIVEVVHRAIPYPLVVVLAHNTECLISVAHKRLSLSERDAVVVEEFHSTDWINLVKPAGVECEFLDSLRFAGLPQANFYALYSAVVDRVMALLAARLTGRFAVDSTGDRRGRLALCHALTEEIRELRAAVRNESAFNRQVELNTKIKGLERALQDEVARL
jgi:uncharacterized protein DUF4391